MNCKECKAQVPDGAKYCPECGALMQNDNEQQNQPFDPNQQYIPAEQPINQPPVYNEQFPVYTEPQKPEQKNKKKGIIIGVIIAIIISIAGSVITPFLNSNRRGMGDAPENEYEELAVSYFENAFTVMDANKCLGAHTINFLSVYEDMVDVYSANANATKQEYFELLSNNYMIKLTNTKQLLDADLDIIYDSYNDLVVEEFGEYTLSFAVAKSKEITDEDLEYYYEKFDSAFKSINKSADSYIDKSEITNAYKVNVEIVIDGEKTSQEYTNVEEYEVIIVKSADGYEVLYDEYIIDTILYWLEEEII